METKEEIILRKTDYFLIISGYLLFFLFLYFIKENLSPILLAITIFLILVPVIRYRAVKILLLILSFLFFIWLASGMMSFFQVFIFGIFIAYLLNPLVEKLEKKIKRPLAVIIVLVIIFSILALAISILLPKLLDSLRQIYTPATLKNIRNTLTNTLYPLVNQFGLDKGDLRNYWETKAIPGIENLLENFFLGLSNIGDLVLGLFKQILYFFILPFFIYYILVDWKKIWLTIEDFFPEETRPKFRTFMEKVDKTLSSYIRGLIFIAILNIIDVSIILYISGNEYAILIGLISGLFTFIPQFGVIISIVVNSIIIMMMENKSGSFLPVTIITLLLHNILESAFLTPKIVGKKVNVHPALAIVAIFVFAYLFGFFGLIIAVPITAIIASLYREWKAKNDLI